jgi:transcriptional regulator with XRE-family HTH domain
MQRRDAETATSDANLRTIVAGIDRLRVAAGQVRLSLETDVEDLDWQRVADAIRARLDELVLSQKQLADMADVAPNTLANLLNARATSYRRHVLVKVSSALGWGANGLVRIGQGEDPDAVEADVAQSGDDSDLLAALRRIEDELSAVRRQLGRRGGQ